MPKLLDAKLFDNTDKKYFDKFINSRLLI